MNLFSALCLPVVSLVAAASSAFGAIITKPVAYDHDGVTCIGYLAYDDAHTAKRPGVLVVPEWWGANDFSKHKARELAELGYVAFVADMYGDAKVTDDAKVAGGWAGSLYGKPLLAKRARAGLDCLVRQELVDTKKLAAIGFCFGGTACQALAYDGAPLVGIVSLHGGLLPPPAGFGAKNSAKFLVLNGAADPMVKPAEIQAFQDAAAREKLDFQFVNYAGALHAFSNPGATALAEKNGLSAAVGYHESAARRSQGHMKLFFDEIFGAK